MKKLFEKINKFVDVRDWDKYHSPKNLAMALSAETAEIVELFQWLTEEESYKLDEKKMKMLKEEIGDVMIYLTNLASKFDMDPVEAALQKLKLNEQKYPVDRVKGSNKKYNEY
ncbi:nucleotide pyrophosphohydrolase [Bacteroidota bacterium]